MVHNGIEYGDMQVHVLAVLRFLEYYFNNSNNNYYCPAMLLENRIIPSSQ